MQNITDAYLLSCLFVEMDGEALCMDEYMVLN